jgi:hypothetical protein
MGLFKKDATPAQSASYDAIRPITAAAARIKIKDKTQADLFKARRSGATADWQNEAWEYFDAITEIKYAFNLVGSVVSRIRLYAAVVADPAETPVPIDSSDTIPREVADAAIRGLARLDSAFGGQPGLLRDAALNLSVAGECYLVQVPQRYAYDGSIIPESWDIRSVNELSVDQSNTFTITPRRDVGQGGSFGSTSGLKPGTIQLPDTAFVGRLWRAHPRYSEEPDSSMRGLLDLCDELMLLSRTFRATHRSRLNAGAMFIPDGLSNAATPAPEMYGPDGLEIQSVTQEEVEDEFEDQLVEAMTTPIEDETSAAAVVPLIFRGPGEMGDQIKQFDFARSFEETHVKRADRVLERILQGLDVPKDVVTGMANIKYSNAIQIDESLYKAHIEPMLLMISDAITNMYLRPYLLALGYDEADVNRIVIWYDPSAVATRNDRAQDADSGYEKGAISAQTWRRAHGFSDDDAPSSTEMVLRMLTEKGTIDADLSAQLLAAFAPDVMKKVREAQQASSVAPVPDAIQDAAAGAPGAPADAPVDPAAPPADPTAPPAEPEAPGAPVPAPEADEPVTDAPTPPGEDGPPFPLAEPE